MKLALDQLQPFGRSIESFFNEIQKVLSIPALSEGSSPVPQFIVAEETQAPGDFLRAPDAAAYLSGMVQPLLKKMSQFPAPTFAAAQGACLGVGLGLLLATDVVYVAENAKFGSPFAKLGATLDSGGHWYFTERLGMRRTLDLIYTAELMSGTEAVAQGMFSRAMPADELLASTRAIVSRVATGASGDFTASRELVAHIRYQRLGLWDAMAEENAEQARLCKSADYAEGFRAFQEKREPKFTGTGG